MWEILLREILLLDFSGMGDSAAGLFSSGTNELHSHSNSCRNIAIFQLNKLNFCCGNYLREETIQGQKLYEDTYTVF